MAKTQNFSTLDIYLASYLSLHQQEPLLELKTGKVVFTFPATDSLYRLMNDYTGNAVVAVADFVTVIKALRGKMLSAKENAKGQGHDDKKPHN